MHSPDNSPVIEGLTPSQLIRSPRRIATLAHHSVTVRSLLLASSSLKPGNRVW